MGSIHVDDGDGDKGKVTITTTSVPPPPRLMRYKATFLGYESGGKSTIRSRLATDLGLEYSALKFNDMMQIPLLTKDQTIGITCHNISINENATVYKNTHLLLFMVDATDLESINRAQNMISTYSTDRVDNMMVLTKCDHVGSLHEVSNLKVVATSNKMDYHEVGMNKFGDRNSFIYSWLYNSNNNSLEQVVNNNNNNSNEGDTFYDMFIRMMTNKLEKSVIRNIDEWDFIPLVYPTDGVSEFPNSKSILPHGMIRIIPWYNTNLPTQTLQFEYEESVKMVLFHNVYLRRKVWSKINQIHRIAGDNFNTLRSLNVPWLARYQYWSAIKLVLLYYPERFVLTKFSLAMALRTCNDVHLLLYMYESFPSMFQSNPVQVMDEICVSGNLEMFKYLYDIDSIYRCSHRGLRLSVQFGNLPLLQFIVKNILDNQQTNINSSNNLEYNNVNDLDKNNIHQMNNAFPSAALGSSLKSHLLPPLKYLTYIEVKFCCKVAHAYGKDSIHSYLESILVNLSIDQTI